MVMRSMQSDENGFECFVCNKTIKMPQIAIFCYLCNKRWHDECGEGCDCFAKGFKKASDMTIGEFLKEYPSYTRDNKEGIRTHLFAFLCDDEVENDDILEMILYAIEEKEDVKS